MTKGSPKIKRNLGLFAGALFLTGLGTYLYASKVAARSYRLERVRVVLKNRESISSSENPRCKKRCLSILHLSDLHLSRGDDKKAEFLRAVTDYEYDMVVITGDIFEDETGLPYASSLLSKKPRLGAYAVLGNHDYYAYNLFNKTVGQIITRFERPAQRRDVGAFIEALEDCGYQVLRNELVRKAGEIALIGIDYPGIDQDQLTALVRQASSEELLMAILHLPNNLELLRRSGIRFVLGGHTHGGQVRLPGVGAIITKSEIPRQEASGLIWRGDTAVHISRGVGTDPRTNFRLFCPPAGTIVDVTV